MSVETEPEAAREAGRADASNVAAISVKIPPFLPSEPQVWFAQVEAQFSTLVPSTFRGLSAAVQISLFTIGKRPGQSLAATSATGLQPSRLFYVTDHSTGLRFLVDTGAEICVIPPSRTDRKHQQDDFSLPVNNTAIATYGRRTFRWIFVFADVKNPMLGADFLRHYCLLVDVRQSRLSDSDMKVQGIVCQDSSPSPTILPRSIRCLRLRIYRFPHAYAAAHH